MQFDLENQQIYIWNISINAENMILILSNQIWERENIEKYERIQAQVAYYSRYKLLRKLIPHATIRMYSKWNIDVYKKRIGN